MYNSYIDLKRKNQIEDEKKEEEKKKRLKKKHDQQILEYTKKYEDRIKNFIYQMVEKPILIQNNKDKISTTREQLLNEEKNKIISNKSFVSHFNRIDKDKYFHLFDFLNFEFEEFLFLNHLIYGCQLIYLCYLVFGCFDFGDLRHLMNFFFYFLFGFFLSFFKCKNK